MKKKQIPVLLSEEDFEKLDLEAKKIMGTRGQIMRLALREYLENKKLKGGQKTWQEKK